MPKCACTRCGQHIEYENSYEGEEVICPGCDNITMLKAAASAMTPVQAGAIPAATRPPQPGSPVPAKPAVPVPSRKPGPTTSPPSSTQVGGDGALPAKIVPGAAKKKSATPPPPPKR